jgi:Fis family transcriptional regulator
MTTTDDFGSTPLRDSDTPLRGIDSKPAMQQDIVGKAIPESLRTAVETSVGNYLSGAGKDSNITDLYQLVLNEVEGPLLEAVLNHTSSNQSKASIMLGLNRGTLRKKLKQHGLL